MLMPIVKASVQPGFLILVITIIYGLYGTLLDDILFYNVVVVVCSNDIEGDITDVGGFHGQKSLY